MRRTKTSGTTYPRFRHESPSLDAGGEERTSASAFSSSSSPTWQLALEQSCCWRRSFVEVTFRNPQCQVESGGLRTELPQLQRDALADGTRTHTGGIETLHLAEHSLDLRDVALELREQALPDLLPGCR